MTHLKFKLTVASRHRFKNKKNGGSMHNIGFNKYQKFIFMTLTSFFNNCVIFIKFTV